jgi:hypothetical protein
VMAAKPERRERHLVLAKFSLRNHLHSNPHRHTTIISAEGPDAFLFNAS